MKFPWHQPVPCKPHLYRLFGVWYMVRGNAGGHPWHRRRVIVARNGKARAFVDALRGTHPAHKAAQEAPKGPKNTQAK